ncbi:uncharacterized protein LOC135169658 isoform X2 [Diachasmimorpha longicaudata]|uniref:uncharacterized protein LOC135169658 isoform X2 n=1 Tax=Diachasmimorpha longicaudata TaxID=58733 RepID=UPI0030B89344
MNYIIPESLEEVLSGEMCSEEEQSTDSVASADVTSLGYQNISGTDLNIKEEPSFISDDVMDEAKNTETSVITSKSQSVYDKTYKNFLTFLKENKIKIVNEKVLLEYFYMLGRSMAPKSLWAIYSMLKRTLHIYDGHQINNYQKLTMFLSGNEKASTHVPKQARPFTVTQIQTFIEEAPDMIYLPQKVTAIIGIHGLRRAAELYSLTLDNIEDHNTCIIFVLERTKNGFERKNLFVKYSKGRCHRQVIGIHAIAKFPKQIASYLNLANPDSFTGHSFRCTGATSAS